METISFNQDNFDPILINSMNSKEVHQEITSRKSTQFDSNNLIDFPTS